MRVSSVVTSILNIEKQINKVFFTELNPITTGLSFNFLFDSNL